MDTKRLYVDFHVLQTVPPSCVNRDDTGSPKTAVYGGATRARVSSQAWKHAIRKMFAEEMADMVETGKRTLKATDLVAGELAALAPELDDARLKKDAKKALENAGIKLKDDNNAALLFLSTAQARALARLLRPSYRRAASRRPDFDRTVEEQLRRLDELEAERCPSLDRAADTFAELLRAAAPSGGEESRDRAMEQLLYHLGRWIYLLDAQDDLEEDWAAGRYNPVAARFGPEGDPDAMARTLDHSRNLMYSAAQLADFGCRWPLIENILYLGLPLVQRAVFDGSWKQIQKQKIWRSST